MSRADREFYATIVGGCLVLLFSFLMLFVFIAVVVLTLRFLGVAI